jgi:hypothetical protein
VFAPWQGGSRAHQKRIGLVEAKRFSTGDINDLRSTGGVPRTQVELLNSANATVISALADLEQANTNLGETLSLARTG